MVQFRLDSELGLAFSFNRAAYPSLETNGYHFMSILGNIHITFIFCQVTAIETQWNNKYYSTFFQLPWEESAIVSALVQVQRLSTS